MIRDVVELIADAEKTHGGISLSLNNVTKLDQNKSGKSRRNFDDGAELDRLLRFE